MLCGFCQVRGRFDGLEVVGEWWWGCGVVCVWVGLNSFEQFLV